MLITKIELVIKRRSKLSLIIFSKVVLRDALQSI